MRKLLTISCMGVTLHAFSFFPFEGPHHAVNTSPSQTKEQWEIYSSNFNKTYMHVPPQEIHFLYEIHTSTVMEIIMPERFTLRAYNTFLDILKGDFDYEDVRSVPEHLLPYIDYDTQHLFKLKNGNISSKKNRMTLNLSDNVEHLLHCPKSLKTLYNVKIKNKGKEVFLSKNGKTVELTDALKQYFVMYPQYLTDFIPALSKINLSSNEEPLFKMYNLNFYNTIQDRLDQSKILAVWNVIPTQVKRKNKKGQTIKKTIESKIVGLAEDKNGKLFHWITDLKKDISVLMQYAK